MVEFSVLGSTLGLTVLTDRNAEDVEKYGFLAASILMTLPSERFESFASNLWF